MLAERVVLFFAQTREEFLGNSPLSRGVPACLLDAKEREMELARVSAAEFAELLRKAANQKLAERVGFVEISFRPSSDFCRWMPTLSDSAS